MSEMVPMAAMPALPGTSAVATSGQLSQKAKAAIVVRLLIDDGADIPLEDLPEELQAQLTQQMGALRMVDRDTLTGVVEEFAQELEQIGLSFSGGIAGALDALEGKISKQTAARLRKEAGVRQYGDPWERLREMGPEKLCRSLKPKAQKSPLFCCQKLT